MKSQSQLSNCETVTQRKGEWAKAGMLTCSSIGVMRRLGIGLPAGRYRLIAKADGLGKVNLPFQIDNGALTKVVLKRFRGENDIW